jgi:hypothetical protein
MKPSSSRFSVGDFVRILKIPPDLHDAAAMDTPRVFAQALGKTFRVKGFNEVGHLELVVAERQRSRDSYESDTIWIEPQFVAVASRPV